MAKRIFNFNAGPATLPEEVLREVQAEMLDFAGTGMSVLEISHRSPVFEKVIEDAKNDAKELLGLPDNYEVFFMGGGASLQFSCVPYNFLKEGTVAAYADTGSFSAKAFKEAEKTGVAKKVFSSADTAYNIVPATDEIILPENCAYLHITGNNTIEGTEYSLYPETGEVPLIADMSSDIFSRRIPVEKFSLIYAGVQKNIGPAGAVIIIADRDFVNSSEAVNLPAMMDYKLIMEKNSMYNTPPVFPIYVVGKVLRLLKEQGGLEAAEERNRKKASLIYEMLDLYPDFYKGRADKKSRSLMNVTFNLPTEELEKLFVEKAAEVGLCGLKGHRSAGGIRASVYNAMPLSGCEKLAEFMKKFYNENRA